jgi:cell division protein FtsB
MSDEAKTEAPETPAEDVVDPDEKLPLQQWRGTRFDIQTIGFGPNQVRVIYTERGVAGSNPPFLDIHETKLRKLGTKWIKRFHALMTELETCLEPEHEAWCDSPQGLHDRMHKARLAHESVKEATERLEQLHLRHNAVASEAQALENFVQNKKVEGEVLATNYSTMQAMHDQLQAEHDQLKRDVAAKRREIAAMHAQRQMIEAQEAQEKKAAAEKAAAEKKAKGS